MSNADNNGEMPPGYDPASDEFIIGKTIDIYRNMAPLSGGTPLSWPDWANFAMNISRVHRGYPVFEVIPGKMKEIGEIARRLYESRGEDVLQE